MHQTARGAVVVGASSYNLIAVRRGSNRGLSVHSNAASIGRCEGRKSLAHRQARLPPGEKSFVNTGKTVVPMGDIGEGV